MCYTTASRCVLSRHSACTCHLTTLRVCNICQPSMAHTCDNDAHGRSAHATIFTARGTSSSQCAHIRQYNATTAQTPQRQPATANIDTSSAQTCVPACTSYAYVPLELHADVVIPPTDRSSAAATQHTHAHSLSCTVTRRSLPLQSTLHTHTTARSLIIAAARTHARTPFCWGALT